MTCFALFSLSQMVSPSPVWSVLLVMSLAGTAIASDVVASDVVAPGAEPAPHRCLSFRDFRNYWETVYQQLRHEANGLCGGRKSAVSAALQRLDSVSNSMLLVIVVIVVLVTGLVAVTVHRFQSFEVLMTDEPVIIARARDVAGRQGDPPPDYDQATNRQSRRSPRETSL